MADHVRKQIRAAVAAALTGLPSTADRVYVGRKRKLGKDHPPSLLIYTTSETSQRDAYPTHVRSLVLYVEALVVTSDPPDDDLDAIAVEVEGAMAHAMASGSPLASLIYNLDYNEMQQGVEAPGDKYLGGVRLQYTVSYRVREGAPIEAV